MAEEVKYNNTLVSGRADETLSYTRYIKDESSGKSTKELLDEKVNKTDQLGTTQIADNAVTTEKLENESVTTDKLNAASVTTDKVADANITTSKLADSSVETEKINNSAVTTDKLNDGAVDNSKLSPNAVTSEKIKNGSIITEKLNDRAVTTEKVEEKAVTNSKLGDQSVDGRVVREASLETKHFANESVTTEKVARKSITKDKLADNSVDDSQVVDGCIGNAKLSPDSVTTEKIKDSSVTNEKVADDTLGIEKFDPELRKTIQAATGLPEDLSQMIQDVDKSVKQLHEKDTNLQSQIDDNQQQITANKSAQDAKNVSLDENMTKLNTRDDQITETLKNISATGGASVASAVTYDNTTSQLTSANIQGAVDELVVSKIDKASISQEFGNFKDMVPSQDVVSRNFNNLSTSVLKKKDIDQGIGSSTEKVVSQKAITERLLFSDENMATAILSNLVYTGTVETTYYSLVDKELISGNSYVVEITLTEDAANATIGLTNETNEDDLVLLYKGSLSAGVHRFLFPYKGEFYLRTFADDGYTKFSEIKFYESVQSTVKSVKSNLDPMVQENIIPLVEGGIINTTAFVTNDIANTSEFLCAFIEVHKGDIIRLKGRGGINFRLYSILDENYNIVENKVADINAEFNSVTEIVIEEGDRYCVLNIKKNVEHSVNLYRNKVCKENYNILNSVSYQFEDIQFMDKYGYINNGATLGELIREQGRVTQKVCVKEGEVYKIKARGGVNFRAFSSIKENGEICRVTAEEQGIDLFVRVLADEKYFVVNSSKDIEYYIKKVCTKEKKGSVTIALSTASEDIKAKADYIIDSSNIAKEVSSFANRDVILLEGDYVLDDSPIIVNKAIKIKGEGNVTISRNSGYIIKVDDAIEGFELENLTLNSQAVLYNESYGKAYKLKNITYNGTYIKNFAYTNDSRFIVSIGNGENSTMDDFSQLLDWAITFAEKKKKELFIYVYGQNKTSKNITIDRHVNIIGKTKDASIEVDNNTSDDGIRFIYTKTYGEMNSYVEGVRFIRSGEFNGYQMGAVFVSTNSITFRDCVFENITSSPEAFNQATDTHGLGVNPYGDRRHGILIECSKYEDCEVVFHNCKAIGSPYGFKNTRGWYIKKGSPRLYDCIGIGGGIGERGYGIVLHMASKAFVYNSQFYGSPYGYRLNNGMEFQAATESRMYHCTGFAGNGFQHISNGGKNIVKQNTRCGASYGVGCIMDVSPLLIDCVGYSGWAEGSYSLYIADTCHPIIQGGVYSIDTIIYHDIFKKDSGSLYMTLPLDNVEQSITITGIYIRDSKVLDKNKVVIKSGDTIIAEEVIRITELSLKILADKIAPNKSIEFHITDLEGNDVLVDDNFTNIIVRYTSGNSWSPKFEGDNTHSKINNAFFDTV